MPYVSLICFPLPSPLDFSSSSPFCCGFLPFPSLFMLMCIHSCSLSVRSTGMIENQIKEGRADFLLFEGSCLSRTLLSFIVCPLVCSVFFYFSTSPSRCFVSSSVEVMRMATTRTQRKAKKKQESENRERKDFFGFYQGNDKRKERQ